MKLKLQTKKPKHNKYVHSIGLAKKFGFIHPFTRQPVTIIQACE